jgi:hypothetical protein
MNGNIKVKLIQLPSQNPPRRLALELTPGDIADDDAHELSGSIVRIRRKILAIQ